MLESSSSDASGSIRRFPFELKRHETANAIRTIGKPEFNNAAIAALKATDKYYKQQQ